MVPLLIVNQSNSIGCVSSGISMKLIGFSEPSYRLFLIFLYSRSITITASQIIHAPIVSFFGTFLIPLNLLYVVFLPIINQSSSISCISSSISMKLIGLLEPSYRLFLIFLYSLSITIATSQIIHAPIVSFFGTFLPPLNFLYVVFLPIINIPNSIGRLSCMISMHSINGF